MHSGNLGCLVTMQLLFGWSETEGLSSNPKTDHSVCLRVDLTRRDLGLRNLGPIVDLFLGDAIRHCVVMTILIPEKRLLC